MPIHAPSNWTPFIACIQLKIIQFIDDHRYCALFSISQNVKPCYSNIPSVLLPYLRPTLIPSSDPAQHDCTQLEGNGEPRCVDNEKKNHKL